MSDSYERWVIEYEAARNRAMDDWFNARLHFIRTHDAEIIFEGGFRMAYDPLSDITPTPTGNEKE